jgi:hypothetical protein
MCRSPNALAALAGATEAPLSFFLTAEVSDFVQHIADPPPVDHVSRRDFVKVLAAPAAQPNVHSFFKGELGLSGVVVLLDHFSQDRLSLWRWRRESASVDRPTESRAALDKCARLFHALDLQISTPCGRIKRRTSRGPQARFTRYSQRLGGLDAVRLLSSRSFARG